ncbi:MAG: glycosyltransferase family 2 protein [Candidatus Omnitrophota bacterium]|jgi:hypothetical protein
MVQDENVFLPIWLKYYSKCFSREDIYIINHNSRDENMRICSSYQGVNIIRAHHDSFDDIWKICMVKEQQTKLLQCYEYVLYTDADEIIIPNPGKYKDLKEYVSRFDKRSVCCTGYELIHLREEEPRIDLKASILEQRKYWFLNALYNKPLLSNIPMDWTPGFHSANNRCLVDADLWLLHLHKFDFDLCWQKHKKIAAAKHNPLCIKKGYAYQYQISTLEEFTKLFHTRCFDHVKLERSRWRRFMSYLRIFATAKIFKHQPIQSYHEYAANHPLIARIPKILRGTKII